jgi:uncharacterized protein (DUF427 family)
VKRFVLSPSAAHPITIVRTRGEVVVSVSDREVARTTRALTLLEATYHPVQYIPIEDVDATVLRQSATASYCPYKGDAAYYSVDLGDGVVFEDLIWTYREPYPAVAAIAGRLAFYANRAHVTLLSK